MAIQCPKCHDSSIRRSRRRIFDLLFLAFGLMPLRCNVCEHRFFRLRKNLVIRSH
jgi:ABC-type proline/glycine betaine transport system ATPase subunit